MALILLNNRVKRKCRNLRIIWEYVNREVIDRVVITKCAGGEGVLTIFFADNSVGKADFASYSILKDICERRTKRGQFPGYKEE